jgi:ketosteroid isomerase-like protein
MNNTSLHSSLNKLLTAFGTHDKDAYFSCFHPEATFMFYTVPDMIPNRYEYQKIWREWEENLEFKVMGCVSKNQNWQYFQNTAIFTHQVETQLKTIDGQQTINEKESIVFQLQDNGEWLCIHEHLSPLGDN